MMAKTNKTAALLIFLSTAITGFTYAADFATHVYGAKKQTLDPASNTVSAGYYAATTLSAVDPDLNAENIKTGVTIFATAGTFTADATAVESDVVAGKTFYAGGAAKTGTQAWPPYPTAGGEWILVPGSASLGTNDFYVMKYEAKNVSGAAFSQAALAPWGSIPQTTQTSPAAIGAIQRCAALGAGYHLLNLAEVQTINLNIAAQTANWADGVIGSAVGTGGLKRGNVALTDSVSYALTPVGPDYTGTASAGSDRTATSKAKLVLSNGKTTPDNEIWDWSGNMWEWIYGAGTDGTLGTPGGVGFYSTAGWIDWTSGSLGAHEKAVLGPSNGTWTGATNGVGQYYGGASSKAVFRGGYWSSAVNAGVFTFFAANAPSTVYEFIGFRCAR